MIPANESQPSLTADSLQNTYIDRSKQYVLEEAILNPLVSIVINNYNYGRYIRQAIESALSQTYGNCEVVVVDDGSTDQSREIIAEYTNRARIILKENGGQASAFNIGIMQARGAYILLLDSDDYLFPEAIKTCLCSFPKGYSRVYFRLSLVGDDGARLRNQDSDTVFRDFDGDVFSNFSSGGKIFWAPTSANFFETSNLRSVLPVPEEEFRICADAFIAVWSSVGGRVRSIDIELGAYRIHGANNYYSASRFLSDRRLLKNHIEDCYRIPKLLEQATKKAGYHYSQPRDKESFFFLEMICAAHRHKIDSPHVAAFTKNHLLSRITHYVRTSPDPLFTRVRRTAYTSLIIFLPHRLAMILLRLKDLWSYRKRNI